MSAISLMLEQAPHLAFLSDTPGNRVSNGQFTHRLNGSMTGIVVARCDAAAAQWAVVRVGCPSK
eukprot:364481-Chlamydomonas_euryale.AAC.10